MTVPGWWKGAPGDVGQFSNPKDFGELHRPLRDRIYTMNQHMRAIGLAPLTCNSGYRTPWMQGLLRHERCPGHEFDPAWTGRPVTALPYRSKHQSRDACDLTGPRRSMDWMDAHCRDFDLYLAVRTEDWHVQVLGGRSQYPILTYPGPTFDGGAPPPPPPVPKPEEIDMAMPCFREKESERVFALGVDIDGPFRWWVPNASTYGQLEVAGVVAKVPLEDVPEVPASKLTLFRQKR